MNVGCGILIVKSLEGTLIFKVKALIVQMNGPREVKRLKVIQWFCDYKKYKA